MIQSLCVICGSPWHGDKACTVAEAEPVSPAGWQTISPDATILRLRQHIAGLERSLAATQKLAAERGDAIAVLEGAVKRLQQTPLRTSAETLADRRAAIFAEGRASRVAVLDRIVTHDELVALAWIYDPCAGWWRAPGIHGVVLQRDAGLRAAAATPKTEVAEPGGFPLNALRHSPANL